MKRALIALTIGFAGVVGLVHSQAQAQAPDTIGYSKFVGIVHDRGDHATLRVRYQCPRGSADHLWFSLKESADGKKDPKVSGEGSGFGGGAATWYQSHRGYFACDGKYHTHEFTADLLEPGSRGNLVHGNVWVQFCLTNSTLSEDDPASLVVIRQQWYKVD